MVDCSNRIGVIHQRGQQLSFSVKTVEHRQFCASSTNICAQGKGFYRPPDDLVDNVRRSLDIVVIIHRRGVAFVASCSAVALPKYRSWRLLRCNTHSFLPIKKKPGMAASRHTRPIFYINTITGIRSLVRRSRTDYGHRRRHQDVFTVGQYLLPHRPGRPPVHGCNRDSIPPPFHAACAAH